MMNKTTNIAHPLKNRAGSSQGNRALEALSTLYAPIDGKTLCDRLYLISQYAKLVNYYQVQKDQNQDNTSYQQTDNWTDFFENSLPFQLAGFSKTSITDLQEQIAVLQKALNEDPSTHTLVSLLEFGYDRIILPASALYAEVQRAGNTFATRLLGIIKSSYQEPLRQFIALYNASAVFLCIPKKSFIQFVQPPWQLHAQKDIYALHPCIQQVKKGKIAGYLLAGEIATGIFEGFLSGLGEIIGSSSEYVEESLIPLEVSLQQKHEPHLALLFTFLELFKHVQGNINELGKKHLDFFYKDVLGLMPKEAMPDKAHLVFEIAKHLENGYLLPEGLLFKDGKDAKNQDIQFGLDKELVIDKAQISELRSLSLYPVSDNNDKAYIEGVYIAPIANSLDGKGEKIKEKGASWATLGDKYSKQIHDGRALPDENPPARMGFVLSSPVLLLQEGSREVSIVLNCDLRTEEPPLSAADKDAQIDTIADKLNITGVEKLYLFSDFLLKECDNKLAIGDKLSFSAKQYISKLLVDQDPYEIKQDALSEFLSATDPVSCEPMFTPNDKVQLINCLNSLGFASKTIGQPLFKVSFSGEKGWIPAVPAVSIIKKPMLGGLPLADLQLMIKVVLGAEEPAVVFYDEGKIKEKFDLKDRFPLVKIELNDALKIPCSAGDQRENRCCLKKEGELFGSINISPYELLQKLVLTDAKIDVNVCGVKNLIVQNDDNLQDVNKPIMPFGPRPKLDASFIIGSKEVFCKDWEAFRLNLEWKDRPLDFNDQYEAYNQDPPPTITDASFDIEASMLEDANWKINGSKKLFTTKENFPPCPGVNLAFNYNAYVWNRSDFPIGYTAKSMPLDPLTPFNITSRKAFLRVQLKGEDFQHDRYAYVLAQQMLKLSRVADLIKMEGFLDNVDKGCNLASITEVKVNTIETEASGGVGSSISQDLIDQLFGTLLPIDPGLDDISDDLKDVVCDLRTQIENITGGTLPVLPKEPYTPLIKSLSIDYRATAHKDDLELIHLYPYENTSKHENLEEKPTLLPYFDEEGTLFIGLEELTPGGNLSLLFQLAEATADSEQERARINWNYLSNNNWRPLLPNFDVINDTTDGLTVTGIVTIAIPQDISKNGHTIMPADTYWIKVSAPLM